MWTLWFSNGLSGHFFIRALLKNMINVTQLIGMKNAHTHKEYIGVFRKHIYKILKIFFCVCKSNLNFNKLNKT